MPTQHPINPNLTDDDLTQLCDALTDITLANEAFHLDGLAEFCERVLPLDRFNELRAVFGSIREAHSTVCEILYGTPDSQLGTLDTAPSRSALIVESKQRHPSSGNASRVVVIDDEAARNVEMANEMPLCAVCTAEAGIMTADEAAALIEPIAEHVEADQASPTGIPWYQYNKAADRLAAQLQRGVITRDEYEAATAALNAQAGMLGGAPAISDGQVPG